MDSFEDCPRELTGAILKHVSTSDLAALSLTSKELHAAATPLLYSQINLNVDRHKPLPLVHLCRSIFRNPGLAICIRSVRLRDRERVFQYMTEKPHCFDYQIPRAPSPQLTNEDGLLEFVSFISGSGLSYADVWTEKLRTGNLNACVALLLSKLPNIRIFRVGYAVAIADITSRKDRKKPPKPLGESQFLGKIFQSAAFDRSNHGISRFQHLEDVFYPGPIEAYPGRNSEFSNPKDVMALLSLPSLRSFSGWCLNPRSLPCTWPGPAAPPNLTHLTSLTMSFVCIDFLGQIIERTTNLKKLTWEWNHICEFEPLDTSPIDLGRFVETLKPCQNTLEDLTINFIYGGIRYSALFGRPRPFILRGNLHGLDQFVQIKRFEAPIALLLPDWDRLEESVQFEDNMPPNVEVVTISDGCDWNLGYPYYQREEEAMLRSWVTETAPIRTPKLVEICLYSTNDCRYDEFRRVFEGSSLRHRIIDTKYEAP